jgi:hypothetical protein
MTTPGLFIRRAYSVIQYLTLNIYNVATIATLLILALAFGVVFAWTRSEEAPGRQGVSGHEY